jgi:hypothetical protein
MPNNIGTLISGIQVGFGGIPNQNKGLGGVVMVTCTTIGVTNA